MRRDEYAPNELIVEHAAALWVSILSDPKYQATTVESSDDDRCHLRHDRIHISKEQQPAGS